MNKMRLVLETGEVFEGGSCGAEVCTVGEIVFNTSMVGYQEVISDPAYTGQLVVMTYPLIGQYGIMDEDYESRALGPAGLIVREYCDTPSNFRYTKTLGELLEEHDIPCLCGPDTRMLTRIIRDHSCLKAALVTEDVSVEKALMMIKEFVPQGNPVAGVSCRKRSFSRTPHHKLDVVAIDCGIKQAVVRQLNERGCNVTTVPFDSSVDDILSFKPDGVMVSSGPGRAEALPELVKVIRELKERIPVFGIGLGCQLIGLACGAGTVRLDCGHHGGDAVRKMEDGSIVIAELNHDYALDEASLEGTGLEITHRNVSDGSVQGVREASGRVCGVQFLPEGGPGPVIGEFFDGFVKAMEEV